MLWFCLEYFHIIRQKRVKQFWFVVHEETSEPVEGNEGCCKERDDEMNQELQLGNPALLGALHLSIIFP